MIEPLLDLAYNDPASKIIWPPWTIKETAACFVVEDYARQALATSRTRQRSAANQLTKDEARRIAANIAKLPVLLGKG